MAMNRVQFQPGLSLPAFLQRYGKQAQCQQALQPSRWPQGFACPRCQSTQHSKFHRHGPLLAVFGLPPSGQPALGHGVRQHQAAATTWLLALEEQGHAHTDIVSPGRAGCEQEHARWVNIVLSNPKRSLDGTHHAFAYFKYAHRTLAEAAWQFNRRFDLAARVPRLLVAAATTKPWSERQLRDVPVYAS